jgi:hypothetical protein
MPDYSYSPRTRRYSSGGKTVPPERVREWVSEIRGKAQERMKAVTEQFVAGKVNRAAWTIEMRSLISRSHGAVAMMAQGGKKAMDEKAWGRVGQRIKSEAEYLRGFERDIANGKAGTEAQIVARAQLYANALHGTYEGAVIAREKAAGVTRVLRVLGEPKTEHCSDCPGLAGEYDIDKVPQIGDSECQSACNCYIESVEAEGVAA